MSVSRRDAINAIVSSLAIAPFAMLQANANELIPEDAAVKMSDEVKRRKERLAAKAAKEKTVETKSSSGEPVKRAAKKEESKGGGGLLVNPSKTADLAAGKNARLAALKEKAAMMRAGGEPTF